ncbi:MAG: hypothetical protein MZW92_61025 [Comamonadaceae bacterium]|nr:hypothetical protein [Comamonadaceae bacterium]
MSFTRGILLGGLDAPTGGQSQSNPHPVLIRLEDNAVLPNRYRAECQGVLRHRRRLRRHQLRAGLPAHRIAVLRAQRRLHDRGEDPGLGLRRRRARSAFAGGSSPSRDRCWPTRCWPAWSAASARALPPPARR